MSKKNTKRSNDSLFSSARTGESERDTWETPKPLFDSLNERHHFTLDAAASQENHLCGRYITLEQDALKQAWDGRVFLNPPYSELYAFGKKIWYEIHNNPNCALVVAVVPARTDTKFWHEFVWSPQGLLCLDLHFVKGRITFWKNGAPVLTQNKKGKFVKNTAPFPSAIITWHNRA